MKISDIKENSLSLILANYYICEHCQVVDKEIRRAEQSFQCPTCGRMSDSGAIKFFNLNILTLIDLIQEAFFTKSWKESVYGNKKITVPSLSVLVFFCTLREVLLDSLIDDFMVLHDIPQDVRKKLFDDNKNYSDKMNRLFPSLAGVKSWKEAINQIKVKTGKDHNCINNFLKRASAMRNEILHEGDDLAFQPYMKKACLENVSKLLELYVDFHNIFIHPLYMSKI